MSVSPATSPAPLVLVIDDDPINLMNVGALLGAPGLRTVGAATGPEGPARFRAERPALVFIDVQLPGQDGFEVCRQLRGLPGGATTPVVMMSAVYTDPDHVAHAAARGIVADAYLAKPFDLAELLAQAQRLLGR